MEEGGARNKLGTGQEGRAKNGSFLLGACGGLQDQGKQLGEGRRRVLVICCTCLHYSGSGEVAERKNEDHRRLGQIASQKLDLGTTNH